MGSATYNSLSCPCAVVITVGAATAVADAILVVWPISGVTSWRYIALPSSSGFPLLVAVSTSDVCFDFLCTDMPRKNAPRANSSPAIETPTPIPAFALVLRPPFVAALVVPVAEEVGDTTELPEAMLEVDFAPSTIAELSRERCELEGRVVGEEVASSDLIVEDEGAAFGVFGAVEVNLGVGVGVGVGVAAGTGVGVGVGVGVTAAEDTAAAPSTTTNCPEKLGEDPVRWIWKA